MKIFDVNISVQVADFLGLTLDKSSDFIQFNQLLSDFSGIKNFLESKTEFEEIKKKLVKEPDFVEEPFRAEYGDFQTNSELAFKIAMFVKSKGINPEVVVEPTCGKGNFIVASLKVFKNIRFIYGVEIYKKYVWESKFNILDFFIGNTGVPKPEIEIKQCNVFDFDFMKIGRDYYANSILIIGNPPWVTNSKLGSLGSANLPGKSNFKNQNGIDAITGKGNFDIAEYITMMMLEAFQTNKGCVAFLVKDSVIKNIVFGQKAKNYTVSSFERHSIDSRKEFNVSVDASVLFCRTNSSPGYECSEANLYESNLINKSFGWVANKFVSNISDYLGTKEMDGICPFEWRQGVKHDLSAIMELSRFNGSYKNKQDEEVVLEDDLVYGILKSSDLKNTVINSTRKFTIITQKKIGQETSYLKLEYPKTHQYLMKYSSEFDARKSSIYKGKPLFSIFGIGDYSFKPYKVSISGLYKSFHFTLVLPLEGKPLMLDDTCYFIGFDNIEFAVYSTILLNSEKAKEFLQSITFQGDKRVFTKDVLMRIDLYKLALSVSKPELEHQLDFMNNKYGLNLNLNCWDAFLKQMIPTTRLQLNLFG